MLALSPSTKKAHVDLISLVLFWGALISAGIAQFIGIKKDKWMGYMIGIGAGFLLQVVLLWVWTEYMKAKMKKEDGEMDPVGEFLGTTSELLWGITIVGIVVTIGGIYAFYKYMGTKPSVGYGILGLFLAPLIWWLSTMGALGLINYYEKSHM